MENYESQKDYLTLWILFGLPFVISYNSRLWVCHDSHSTSRPLLPG
jgi:hypothetical protein